MIVLGLVYFVVIVYVLDVRFLLTKLQNVSISCYLLRISQVTWFHSRIGRGWKCV